MLNFGEEEAGEAKNRPGNSLAGSRLGLAGFIGPPGCRDRFRSESQKATQRKCGANRRGDDGGAIPGLKVYCTSLGGARAPAFPPPGRAFGNSLKPNTTPVTPL
jgi:hypothetical protein